ncbi:MAG: DEAD/DEAH box helicase family protein [Gemmatimonadota bacterium]|nr:DEAD/DEAH box helicase family protein [Gemmatimonadota bacterium]
MKLHFEPDLDFQLQAIEAVCDLFRGQEVCEPEFTVTPSTSRSPGGLFTETHLGIGNRLTLLDEEIFKNLKKVQLANGVPPSESLSSGDFTVEMETGTGKTYVYLRTIFELNKRYGFTKFVIIVPSIAIKEGVYKSIQITEDHFRTLYSGTPFGYFLYDSGRLGEVRNFATSSQIQIMVVTVGAINKKDINNLYKDSEKAGGEKPIDLIRDTHPILIVDEPQSVDGGLGGRGREALSAMNPLCTLRYSATHADQHHMVYRLDAVDAYERKLVKQIEVASAAIQDAHNKAYARLLSTRNHRGTISARIELDVAAASGVRREEKTVMDGDDLEQITGRAIYRDCRIGEIRVQRGKEFLELRVPGSDHWLRPGEAWGDVDSLAVAREMIRRTIREHLDKEMRLRPHGIKVLSLFFVDKVNRYRRYNAAGGVVKGDYARIFEEQYHRFTRDPEYRTFLEETLGAVAAEDVHDGYFSIDRKGGWADTAENTQANRESAERAYHLIMRDKEKLLGLATPLRFIFSHSALREGWDNPNVFQICALRDIHSERERRQTIGRGLRLCVNQRGQRQRGFDINTLTVVARESYEAFAEKLQKEIAQDTGIRFGAVARNEFAAISVPDDNGKETALGSAASEVLWKYLTEEDYLDRNGRVRDSLRRELKDGTLVLPDRFEPQRAEITRILRRLAGRLEIRNADERKRVRPRQAILHSPEFKALWDRIKHKTTYRVAFDNEHLLDECANALRDAAEHIPTTRLQWRKADIAIGRSGVEASEAAVDSPVGLNESDIELPDVLTELQDRTQLTRRSIYQILVESHRLGCFRRNPQKFIEVADQAIRRCKRQALVDGIKYQRLGDDHYYAQELFETEELTGYLKNMMNATKSVHEQVVYESGVESRFAEELEKNTAVKIYAKLPGWFRVPTPLGTYNPDWAVLVDSEAGERLYFVVETKGSVLPDDLRPAEKYKIECGEAHFKALQVAEDPAEYRVTRNVSELFADIDVV